MLTPEIKQEMARLRNEKGYTYQDIADTVGVSKTRVMVILNPATRENHKARKREYMRRVRAARKVNKPSRAKHEQ